MLSAAKRISKTSNRDLKANSLFFIITNLVLFVNYIVQMSIRNFITYYNESITNYYQGYVIAYIGVAAVALCGVFTVFALFHESYSKSHADLAYSLPAGAKERFFSKLCTLVKLHILPVVFWNIIQFISTIITTDLSLKILARYAAVLFLTELSTCLFVDLVVILCLVCCGRLAEVIYTAVIITACEAILPRCIVLSSISIFSTRGSDDIEIITDKWFAWSAFPAYLMDNGYSNALVLMLMGSSLLSAALICLLYFIYKKRDGRATGKPFVFTAFREIVLILGIVTVTTYVLSDPDNIVLLPVVLLSYLLIRIFSAKSTLTIAKFVKWIAVFAVYMIMIFAFNFISYLCDGFAGKPDLSVLTDYDDVWVWVQTDEDIMTYTSSYKNPEGRKTLTKEQAEQLTDIYIKALDSREKSFSDYIDCLKNRNLAGNFASITLYTRNSDDIYSDNNSIIDVIDIDVRLTKNSTEQVAEEIKALDFISPEQISYLEMKEYYD